jgi:hypothetical protein
LLQNLSGDHQRAITIISGLDEEKNRLSQTLQALETEMLAQAKDKFELEQTVNCYFDL